MQEVLSEYIHIVLDEMKGHVELNVILNKIVNDHASVPPRCAGVSHVLSSPHTSPHHAHFYRRSFASSETPSWACWTRIGTSRTFSRRRST